MDFLAWLWWLAASILSLVWSLIWLLLGGWVSTLLQILVIVLVVFSLKYGWRQAPLEMLQRARPLAGWLWSWVRRREPGAGAPAATGPERVRIVRVKERGDVNLSSLLNVLMLGGLCLLAVVSR